MANWIDAKNSRHEITEKIIESMKNDPQDWIKPWQTMSQMPYNPISHTRYRGSNILRLLFAAINNGYDDPRWMTFKQASEAGYKIKKGSKGTLIEFWKREEVKKETPDQEDIREKELDKKDEEKEYRLICRPYHLYNAAQLEGIEPLQNKFKKLSMSDELTTLADDLINSSECLVIEDPESDQAFYNYSNDQIVLPTREKFFESEGFIDTLMHEMSHSTGHESRLNRDLSATLNPINYVKEELVAEFSSVFLGQELHVDTEKQVKNHTAYLQGWIEQLQQNDNLIFEVVAAADKAADRIMEHYTEYLQSYEADREAERDINRHEAEFGADGTRVFRDIDNREILEHENDMLKIEKFLNANEHFPLALKVEITAHIEVARDRLSNGDMEGFEKTWRELKAIPELKNEILQLLQHGVSEERQVDWKPGDPPPQLIEKITDDTVIVRYYAHKLSFEEYLGAKNLSAEDVDYYYQLYYQAGHGAFVDPACYKFVNDRAELNGYYHRNIDEKNSLYNAERTLDLSTEEGKKELRKISKNAFLGENYEDHLAFEDLLGHDIKIRPQSYVQFIYDDLKEAATPVEAMKEVSYYFGRSDAFGAMEDSLPLLYDVLHQQPKITIADFTVLAASKDIDMVKNYIITGEFDTAKVDPKQLALAWTFTPGNEFRNMPDNILNAIPLPEEGGLQVAYENEEFEEECEI